MLKEAMGDLADPRPPSTRRRTGRRGERLSPLDTPIMPCDGPRGHQDMMPNSSVVPAMTHRRHRCAASSAGRAFLPTASGCTRSRIPYTEYPVMFHGHNERVDTESLRLSAEMWEALCRDFLG